MSVIAGLELVGTCVSGLLAVPDLDALDAATLLDVVREVERLRGQFTALESQVVTALERSRPAGQGSVVDVLVSELRLDVREARARVRRAEFVGPRVTLTGKPLPPLLPAAADAAAAGALSGAQLDVIIDCTLRLPCSVTPELAVVVEQTLVCAAGFENPRSLRRTAELLLARLDPDGPEPDDTDRGRHLSLTPATNRCGQRVGRITGQLTTEATALWEAILDSLATPAPSDDQPDPRSYGQRCHDAFVEVAQRVLRSGTLPAAGGTPVTVLVRTTTADLATETGTDSESETGDGADTTDAARAPGSRTRRCSSLGRPGLALTSRGDTWRVRDLLRACSDAAITPVYTTKAGAVLALGRTRRLATPAQRHALTARDGGCCFPSCDRPAAWCEVHHITSWLHGGSTDLDNLTLLCRHHHRTFQTNGWQVHIRNGIPEWTPPPWIDPLQRPRRNTTAHLADVDFRAAIIPVIGRA